MLRNRNWFTLASLVSLIALILYSLIIVWLPGVTFTDVEIGVILVLGVSSIVSAVLSLHYKDSDL
jgi:NADH:ubiquinone oxidoreductase subunit H